MSKSPVKLMCLACKGAVYMTTDGSEAVVGRGWSGGSVGAFVCLTVVICDILTPLNMGEAVLCSNIKVIGCTQVLQLQDGQRTN